MQKIFSLLKEKKHLRNDLILIIIVLLVALVGFTVFKLSQKDGSMVIVSIDGEKTAEYRLDADTEQLIETNGGRTYNRLIIKDGSAYIAEADCPDKICVEHRAISKSGESIVCLPHKLVITVEADD